MSKHTDSVEAKLWDAFNQMNPFVFEEALKELKSTLQATHSQQVEEAVSKALQNVPLGFVRQWINEDRTLPNQKLVTEADIQAFINIALTPNHQD